MLKALRFLALLVVLTVMFFCSSDNNVMTAPYDRYDHEDLFVVLNNEEIDDDFVRVQFGLLREKMNQLGDPFFEGPIVWEKMIPLKSYIVSDDGKYYVLEFTLKYNKEYDLAVGLSIKSKRWLYPEEMTGNKYYNPNKECFSFFIQKNSVISVE
jgi:hypothetical protein